MWIQVRSMDGKVIERINDLSKLTKIDELREKLVELFDAAPERQRLFYGGKQLENGHTLFDYDVRQNDMIQIMIRQNPVTSQPIEKEPEKKDKSDDVKEDEKPASGVVVSENDVSIEGTYKVGDIIDARDPAMGAWFEATVIQVKKNEEKIKAVETKDDKNEAENEKDSENVVHPSTSEALDKTDKSEDDGFLYKIKFESEDEDPVELPVKHIRPRSRFKIPIRELKVGDKVMVNYNYDDPKSRGYWYDCVVTRKKDGRVVKDFQATVNVGADLLPLEDCKILFIDEIMKIEESGTAINLSDVLNGLEKDPEKRVNKPNCDSCHDRPTRNCKFCGCHICGSKSEPDKQIMCDECDYPYHIYCLNPPLEKIPEEDEWYCPECKNDETEVVGAGQKLKESKKKSKMMSATNKTSRDWGKGMACVGRTKVCSIVPQNHFGPIPGVEVGMAWKFRVQVSEAGVHRPHVAGIHGREEEGSYSIVLAGGYEDDLDNGDEFYYTGSGGRDLSGNKRTAEQSSDQLLTRMNKALAKNVNAPLNKEKGAEASDWQGGKPVRVVRSCKGRKHSEYAPEEGNRYDGIYKIVKYWPETGKSGFRVWRYLMRRDDPTPAPWTKEGKKRIESLGLTLQYPEGYLESQKEKENKKEENKGKRKSSNHDSPLTEVKRAKLSEYEISKELKTLINEDSLNSKLWNEALEHTKEGGQKFLAKVEELFCCICCQDVVCRPITTKCSHNICKDCLSRAFKAEVYTCPTCRFELGKDYSLSTNKTLSQVLKGLFPGYETGR